ncbi:DUF4105 domain-containing protein [Flavobacterium sp. SM2513]|uniref:lipoprotein N-acyltransferase Lnb domain-containing protein n=1 Tax=Flavobacterium sp. SM2513 TaxID=3424766 RepID=UPI003D7F53FC
MKKVYLLFVFFCIQNILAQANPDDTIQVSVLTVGVADESHSLYGHTAIRIKDDFRGIDRVYNYGMFDFRTPNFILRFIKGDMQYFAGAYPYADFEDNYHYENRSIYEQTLDLSTYKKLALITELEKSISGDDKFYTYKFIDRNCTTKVADVINDVLQKEVVYKHDVSDLTYREVLYPYAENQFFQKLGINLIFGAKTDQQATKIFLPFDLKNNLAHTEYKDKPLVSETKTLFEATRIPQKVWWDSMYTLLFFLTLIVVINNSVVTHSYFILIGILGIFFCLVGFYSFHKEIAWNYNVLLFNPVLLLVAYFRATHKRTAFMWSSFIALASLVIYLLYMINKVHLVIVWPFMVANAVLLIRGLILYLGREKQRK